MPVNIIVGLLSLLVAVILYTVGTWSAYRTRGFARRQVVLLWTAVVFDVLATVMMGLSVGGLDLSAKGWLHTVVAMAVMAVMAICIALGTLAYARKDDALGLTISRVIVAPWVLWIAVFVWGILARGPGRPG
jgi:fatty acid desaturase